MKQRKQPTLDVAKVSRDFQKALAERLSWYGQPVSIDFTVQAQCTDSDGLHAAEFSWGRVLDPIFGELTWDMGEWVTHLALPGFGPGVRINIRGETDAPAPPTKAQQQAFGKFISRSKQLARLVEKANWTYYQQYRREQFDDTDDEMRSILPDLTKPAGLQRLLSRFSVRIPPQPPRHWELDLNWECRWDPEHGHKVIVRNGKVVYVGTQAGG